METFLHVLAGLALLALVGWTVFATYQMLKFARIILAVEDSLSEALDGLQQASDSLDRYLSMRLFYDSPDIKVVLDAALADVKLAKMAVVQVAERFTNLSKQKYVVLTEPAPDEADRERILAELIARYQPLVEPVQNQERDQL